MPHINSTVCPNDGKLSSGFEEKLGPQIYKLALYTDDLLLYITNPCTSIPFLIQEFEIYGQFSNFKVKYRLMEVPNILISSQEVTNFTHVFSLHIPLGIWGFRFLHIYLNFFSLNYPPSYKVLKIWKRFGRL